MEELQVPGVEARRQKMHSEISEKALSGLICIFGGCGQFWARRYDCL